MADRGIARDRNPCGRLTGSDVADAAKARDAAAVKALLKSGADVNAAQGDGMTALHWAATNGDAAVTQMLLSAGANIRATTRLGGITPLLMASQSGHAQVVAALLAAGADANSATATGATALMLAARSGSTETVTRLVETGADINAKEKGFGQTALMVAAGLDRADVVRLLMSRGADWKAASSIADLKALSSPMEDGSGRPQPQVPAGRIDVAGVTRGYRYNELIGTQGGLTALHFAVRQGSAAAARALVEAGANVNLVSPGDQASPLLVALINGHFDLAAFLIDKGANPNLLSDAGVSPLYAVLNVQWAPIAAYPQPRSHLQQSRDYLDVMKLLIDKGADPNARVRRKVWYSGYNFDQSGVDEAGATPFWRAAYAADVAAMKLLVSHGADPSLPTTKLFSRRGPEDPVAGADKSGLPPIVIGGPHADAAARGRRPRIRDGVRRQLASCRAVGHAAGREVSGRRTRRGRQRGRCRRQFGRAQRRLARRHRDGPLPGVEGRRREEDQSIGPDDDRCGEWTGAAHAAVSGHDQAARESRRREQPQVRVVLAIS